MTKVIYNFYIELIKCRFGINGIYRMDILPC